MSKDNCKGYVRIPNAIKCDNRLTAMARLLYGDILSLSSWPLKSFILSTRHGEMNRLSETVSPFLWEAILFENFGLQTK